MAEEKFGLQKATPNAEAAKLVKLMEEERAGIAEELRRLGRDEQAIEDALASFDAGAAMTAGYFSAMLNGFTDGMRNLMMG